MIIAKPTRPDDLELLVAEIYPEDYANRLPNYIEYVDNGISFCFHTPEKPVGIAGVTVVNEKVGLYWGCFSEDARKYKREFFEYAGGLLDLGFQVVVEDIIVAVIDPDIPRDISFIERLGFIKTEHTIFDKDVYRLDGGVYGER